MTDITKRLRSLQDAPGTMAAIEFVRAGREVAGLAADEIERLRAESAVWELQAHKARQACWNAHAERNAARAEVLALVQERECADVVCRDTQSDNCECRRIAERLIAKAQACAVRDGRNA